MSKVLPALLLLCFFYQDNFAQDNNIDARVASISDANCSSAEGLASYIKQNFTTDTGRVRAIYVWIANHISYDVQRLHDMEKNPDNPPQTIADVLAGARRFARAIPIFL